MSATESIFQTNILYAWLRSEIWTYAYTQPSNVCKKGGIDRTRSRAIWNAPRSQTTGKECRSSGTSHWNLWKRRKITGREGRSSGTSQISRRKAAGPQVKQADRLERRTGINGKRQITRRDGRPSGASQIRRRRSRQTTGQEGRSCGMTGWKDDRADPSQQFGWKYAKGDIRREKKADPPERPMGGVD